MIPLDVAERETHRWVREFVVGLDLCPFARRPLAAGEVRVSALDATDFDDAVRSVLAEVLRLAESPAIETTLVVFPGAFGDFEELLDATAAVEHLLETAGLDDALQVVAFHPDFVFEGARAEDPANATNRSPYPTLHLIRQASVLRARETHPDIEGIPERNAQTLRARAEK